ncbi:hypothetical protein HCN44_011035 [Aphidius gifuensis]|uniref:EGF-like domain-containing protein n=1 Tax=Aphidius gifuensis TaxID=684658 RepID=A0A835CWL4_APHGI|nr:low-density lipoprotein receptor-related protein 4 isoform X2 [Aphidius gifuensis]KAF7998627.1 hypothetical protein HCN44_011035 [Aphidius gifuensis]
MFLGKYFKRINGLKYKNITMNILILAVLVAILGYSNGQEKTTYPPLNRGAARQMFGSGKLRQPDRNFMRSTPATNDTEIKKSQKSRNDVSKNNNNNENHRLHKFRDHEYSTDNHDSMEFLPHFDPKQPLYVPEDIRPIDSQSYRNSASVPGTRLPGTINNFQRRAFERSRDEQSAGLYEYDTKFEDRLRILHEPAHGGDAKPIDQKTLIHGVEDENDFNPILTTSCKYSCGGDQFKCIDTCDCIDLYLRCDGSIDCENGEDEQYCDEVFAARKNNGTCHGERNLLCPESGYCISEQWLCDGDDDCGDYSDESHCGTKENCTSDQFECRNGLCVQKSWQCDGENDCRDFSDEEYCAENKKCEDDEHTCPDGTCVLKIYMCDGDRDCDDGSDEDNCHGLREVHCTENYFECSTPRCIRKEFRCDGNDDCGDASDEENCPSVFDNCHGNQFKCRNNQCISKIHICDGQNDCKDGEDETNCQDPTSRSCSVTDEFMCNSGTCVPRKWICDGVPDCSNGEDEEGCPLACDATQFLCKAKLVSLNTTSPSSVTHDFEIPTAHIHAFCISKKHQCDGFPDCPLKEDEYNCPKKRPCKKTDKCSQQCILTVNNKNACSCESGYTLGNDNATCYDINECEFEKEPVCSQLCKNTVGSFMCNCIVGYVLRPDLRTCKAIGGNPSLILTNRVDIRKINISPATDIKYTPILKSLHNAIAMDYHYEKDVIYWSDVSLDVIKKVYLNGSSQDDVIRWGLESPGGVAIDWIHDLLFWTDSGTRRVEVITLESKIRHVLISSDLDKPRAIAVHPHYGYVFWTDWGPNPKIERADMDGSGRISLITDSITWPNGLTIDYPTEKIYWTDAKHPAILSAKLDGTDRRKILSKGLHHPFAITVFEDLIYWTDWHFKSISSANKITGRTFRTIRSGLHFPMDLHSYHKQRQPSYSNHCGKNNGKCSHMCLPNSAGYSCVCPVGLKIEHDGKNCAATVDNLLIFARKRDLRLIPINQSTRVFDTVIPVDHVQSAVALTWDANEDMIYWTDVESDTISRAHLNGTNQSIIINHNLESPAGLAMDWVTKKLYWTDAGMSRIECSNIDGSMRSLLVYEGLDKPRDIVVDPTVGWMYFSDWGIKPKIERVAMDGHKRSVLIGENVIWPNGLAIDFETRRLYWADGGMKSIEYINMDTNTKPTRVRLQSDLPHPFGLVIHQNKVYWTDWDTKSIHRANKDNGENSTVVRSNISGLMDVRTFHRNRPVVTNPCARGNGGCSHLCLLVPDKSVGSYSCGCPTGLTFNKNRKQCRSMPASFLIFAHRVDIRVISFDVAYKVDVVLSIDFLKNASGVDVDWKKGDVYYTDPGSDIIAKTSFDGKSSQIIINSSIDAVDSLVVDVIGRKLYWTDAGLNSIEVSELNGTNRKVLIWSGLDNPRAIALYYAKGLMFWTDWGNNARIERANMDGEERSTVITENLVWPNGLTIDIQTNRLYWNDAKKKVIETSDLDGSNRKVLMKGVQHPYGLSIMGDLLYWSDWQTKSIHQVNKYTGKDARVIVNKLDGIMDVRTINTQDIKGQDDVCKIKNGHCSHLCLRNPRNYSCACPTGILLKSDQKTCETGPLNYLLFAARKTLARMSFDTLEKWEVSLPIKNIHNVYSADFHWKKNLIIYTDIHLHVIQTVNMRNFSDVRTIISESGHADASPFKLAIDWLADNVYWTVTKKKIIEVAKLDGSCRKILLTDLDDPWSIAVFPKLGYLFWTEWGNHRSILRSYLDGTNKKTIISTDLSYPNGLSIDFDSKKIYWADTMKNRIEMADLNGNYRVQIVPVANRPYGLSQYGEYIFWAGWDQDIIQRADKATGNGRINMRISMKEVTGIKAVSKDRQKGWSPCVVDNGGCSHLCLFARKNYTCACPDAIDQSCSTKSKMLVPIRKPGTENDREYDEHIEEDKQQEISNKVTHHDSDDKFKKFKTNKEKSYTTITISIIIIAIITIIMIIAIVYLVCQRKPKQDKYMYPNRRNVLTFSNPNYSASDLDTGNSNPLPEKKASIWKRFKYDNSQENVYENNGQTPSPEVVSLIFPSATADINRASSIIPRDLF